MLGENLCDQKTPVPDHDAARRADNQFRQPVSMTITMVALAQLS